VLAAVDPVLEPLPDEPLPDDVSEDAEEDPDDVSEDDPEDDPEEDADADDDADGDVLEFLAAAVAAPCPGGRWDSQARMPTVMACAYRCRPAGLDTVTASSGLRMLAHSTRATGRLDVFSPARSALGARPALPR